MHASDERHARLQNDIAEFDRNWDEALALCRERSIRDIALGGDLFQSRSAQTLDVLLAVHDALLRAAGAGIRLTIAEGNHDKVNQEDLRGYCHVFDCHPSVTVVDDILTLDDPAWAFSLHMMGYFPEGGSFTSRLAALATSGLVEGKLNYLYIHEGVNGALATAAPCELPPRIFEPFDRVFAGHYHNRAVVPGTRIEYVGSSRQFNFGEDEAKGYTILCTDGSSEFVQNEANIRYKVLDTSADKVGIHLSTASTSCAPTSAAASRFVCGLRRPTPWTASGCSMPEPTRSKSSATPPRYRPRPRKMCSTNSTAHACAALTRTSAQGEASTTWSSESLTLTK